MEANPLTILCGDVIDQLRTLPDESVHCCVASPPYWGLRDYGTAQWEGGENGCEHREKNVLTAQGGSEKQKSNNGANHVYSGDCACGAKRIDSQIGLEKTPEEYVAKMVEVFREVRRVLRKDGTLWLNLGDTYASDWPCQRRNVVGSGSLPNGKREARPPRLGQNLKPKDLCGIPWRVAFALQADGWWLRSDIIWAKPNPMPESVTDRPTKAHEYLFLLTKSANYFYDAEAIREPVQEWNTPTGRENAAGIESQRAVEREKLGALSGGRGWKVAYNNPAGRNKRSVWTVATAPYPEAHFATYPPDLIKPCILAGTSAKGCCAKCGAPWGRIIESEIHAKGDGRKHIAGGDKTIGVGWEGVPRATLTTKTIGWQPACDCGEGKYEDWPERIDTIPCTVIDPFAGSGTTGAVALELGRKAILIELNPKYVELIKQRCNVTMGLALA